MRFLYMLASLQKAKLIALETQRKIDLHNAHLRLTEARIAKENNAVVLQDIRIEVEKLKLAEAEKEANPPSWP